jgi:hypothetical protein
MKDTNNDWIYTPRVRMSVLNPGGRDIVNRPEVDYPLPQQKSLKLFLDGSSKMMGELVPAETNKCLYDATHGSFSFNYEVPYAMEFVGSSKIHMSVEANGSNDMDIFAVLEKYNPDGELQRSTVVDVGWLADDPERERETLISANKRDSKFCSSYFSSGPCGSLRISHRGLDSEQSTDFRPVYSHAKEELLGSGDIVAAEMEIWPYGWRFDAGDTLRLTLSGFNPRPHLRPTDPRPISRNGGQHIIHTGGEAGSYLLLPLISS